MITHCQTKHCAFLVKKRNQTTDFFLSKSMPNFNFAEFLLLNKGIET